MLLPLAAFIFAAFAGCARDVEEDIELIKELLLNSYFTGEGSDGVTDDSTSQIQSTVALLAPMPDTGHQWWVRKIEHFNRNVDVTVEGDSAFAVITNHLEGTIYVRDPDILDSAVIYEHSIDDSTYREVVLSRGKGKLYDGWRIEKITPAKIWTNNPANEVKIAKIKVTSTSGEDFEITDPSDFYGRDDIPWFTPDDTVTVEVTLEDTGVEAWAYLHHGRHFRLKFRHHRKVFDRDTSNTLHFIGTWKTAEDQLFDRPITVRHAAVDVILAQTLDGDSTAEYSAYAIAIPYVIAKPGEELPDDGADDNE